MSLDYQARRRIRDFIRAQMAQPLTAKQIIVHFRLRPDDEPDVRELMTETAILGVPASWPEVVTSPAEVLDQLVFWLASPAVTGGEVRQCLTGCQYCRNHLLYLLDTAPYTGDAGEQITARLKALPVVHEAHGPDGPDQARPRIRWITS